MSEKDFEKLIDQIYLDLEESLTKNQIVSVLHLAESYKYQGLQTKLQSESEALASVQKKLEIAREALIKMSDSVDESLLLDEDLHKDWDKLRNEVIDAKKALKEIEGAK